MSDFRLERINAFLMKVSFYKLHHKVQGSLFLDFSVLLNG